MISDSPIFLGTAGWSLPREHWAAFASEGSQLQRYAGRFAAVEINSSFYRPHRPATYAKWAESVPAAFRFCVKVPKQITHERRLVDCDELLARFLSECGELGEKLGCLLLQLPPSLALDPASAARFVEALRARHEEGGLVIPHERRITLHRAKTGPARRGARQMSPGGVAGLGKGATIACVPRLAGRHLAQQRGLRRNGNRP